MVIDTSEVITIIESVKGKALKKELLDITRKVVEIICDVIIMEIKSYERQEMDNITEQTMGNEEIISET